MLRPTATAIFMLALPLVLACTSNDDASPQTYFEDLEAAKQQHGAALSHELAGLPSAEVVQLLQEENEAIGDFISQLEDLDVPDSLEEAHTLALGLTQQRLSIQEEIASSYFDPTRSNLEARDYLRVTVPRREDARQLWYGAICALEQDAREQDIAINLGCSPEQALALRAVERLDVTLPGGANACQQASEPRVAQVEVGQVTYAQWFNRRDQPVRLYRFEHSSEREFVTTLAANSNSIQVTYIGAGWLVTDQQDNCIGGYLPPDQPININIR